jgi:translocation and assembly module TamB
LLPLIFRRTLPLEVTLIDPNVYLEQDNNGSWLELPAGDSEGEGLPIDLSVLVESGELALLPNGGVKPVKVGLNGEANYDSTQPEIYYDLDTEIAKATANLAGSTSIQTGATKTQILVQKLSLPKVLPLLPEQLPINLRNGNLNADLDVSIPSFTQIEDSRIQGTLSLQQVRARTEQLDKPVRGRSQLRFNGDRVRINNTQASIGEITARVDGRFNWDKGYDIDISVPSFALNKLLKIFPARSPVNLAGAVKGDFQLTGGLTEPLLMGRIGNTQPVAIAKTKFKEVEAAIVANLAEVRIENLNVLPTAGGRITGNGLIKTNRDENALDVRLQARLPAEKLLQPYYASDVPLNVGRVAATAKIDGTVDRPQVLLDWQAPDLGETTATDISGRGQILLNNSLLTVRNTQLAVDDGAIALRGTGNLADNNWQAVLNANNVSLNPWLQSQEELIDLETGNIRLQGKFTPQVLNTINGIANLDLAVGNGDLTVRSAIASGNLNVTARAVDVVLSEVSNLQFSQPVDGRFNLAANVKVVGNQIAIAAKNFRIQLEQQSLQAAGKILVRNLTNNPATDLNLNLQASSNLATLPNRLFDRLVAGNRAIAPNFDLNGKANFRGRLQGTNIFNAALPRSREAKALNLTGNLQLKNLAVDNTQFEPTLAGRVNFAPGKESFINLRGKRDVIATNLTPCNNSQCPLPYLPNFIRVRQGEGDSRIAITGNRQGEILAWDVANFPLSLLNLKPGANLGITGILGGELTGRGRVNLLTGATTARAQVRQPNIGYIDGEAIAANFAYNPQKNLARLNRVTLEFGDSIYTLQGKLNLVTQAIEGGINIPQADIQDLIAIFGWYDLQRVVELFQAPDLATADDLANFSTGRSDARIGKLLKTLILVQQRLQQIAAESEELTVPLHLEGKYRGSVAIAGTLNSPDVSWKLVGNNWLWDTDRNIVFDIPQKPGIIALDELSVAGNYSNNVLTLDSLFLEAVQAPIALEGTLESNRVEGNFDIAELPINAIAHFFEIPLELGGRISSRGKISGRLPTPQIIGDVALTDGKLSDRSLPKITGKYTYNNARLQLDTTETPSAQIQANIPIPVRPQSDRLSLKANLDETGIALIDGFTGGALEFIGGEADVVLDATGRLDLSRDFILQDLDATGEIILNNTVLETNAFTEPLDITAAITIEDRLIQVERLSGTFAKSQISARGGIPLLGARNLDNPLTLLFQESQIDLDRLYEGNIAGEVIITGDAFNPLIGGEIELFDGRVFAPEEDETATTALTNDNNSQSPTTFRPRLQDFKVNVEDIRFELTSVYNFVLAGGLTLNGAANNVPQIKAGGRLQFTRANVDFISSQFNLQQDYDNVIVFDPKETVLNPFIDLRLEAEVSEFADIDTGVVDDNEIPDSISQVGGNETIAVTLAVEGEAEQIVPRIDAASENLCQIEPPFEPLFERKIYTKDELNQLAECVNYNTFSQGSARDLINSPAVSLSSNPPRSQAAIVSLLGNKFVGLAEQLQDSNEEQLFEFGVTQFVITPLEREFLDFTDETINNLGAKIGLDYLQIYPNIRGNYQLSDDSAINATYDYFFNEFKIRYQKQF